MNICSIKFRNAIGIIAIPEMSMLSNALSRIAIYSFSMDSNAMDSIIYEHTKQCYKYRLHK